MYDAILIPGGGVDQNGQLHPWVKARFDAAILHDSETQWYIPLSKGTVHKKSPYLESQVGKDYLVSMGISPTRILIETDSLDTIGNAFFARTKICEPHHLSHLLVITSTFHMHRTKTVFDWIFSLTPTAAYKLEYESTPDDTLPAEILQIRQAKEQASLDLLPPLMSKLSTMNDFIPWLFTQHGAYAPGMKHGWLLDDTLTDSY